MKYRSIFFGAIVGAVVAASVTAWATIPDSNTGAVTLCSNPGGAVRVIDAEAGKKCHRTERTLTLGAHGATGVTGPGSGQGLVVKDANGTIIGSYYGTMGAGVVVLGLDGHIRILQPSTGEYTAAGNDHQTWSTRQYFTTTDCSGLAYASDSFEEAWEVPVWDSIYLFADGNGSFVERQISRDATTRISFSAIRSVLKNPWPEDPSSAACNEFRGDVFPTWTANLLLTPSWTLGPHPVGPLTVVPAT